MQHNRVEIVGYLAAKPSFRFLPSGVGVANARLGESYRFVDSGGNWHKQTNWHSLVFYDPLARVAAGFDKGDNLFVEGRIQQRKFTPSDGSPRTVSEIVVRSCHLVADPREEPGETVTETASDETAEATNGKVSDETWPVG
jgi:single-strand DNA-binding protein